MSRPLLFVPVLLLLAVLGISGAVYAQLETGDRGILPLDSSGTLEIGGIHVDVGAADSQSARYAGWRIAQRQGFRALWAKMHNASINQAPSLPDGTLDQIVSSINVEREEIGPNRYIADLGILFDRARAAPFLGVEGGEISRSQPMLLIRITVTAGTETSVELRNAWQRAWAQFRTSQSPIDYVRVSGMGVDPMLVNAAQAVRPGRGWWRNLIELYGAADILVAEVQLQRAYPGGPAVARFVGRHGPDNEIVGGFTLTARNSDSIPVMMAQGAQRMDQLFAHALAAGRLQRDSSLNLPPPPVQVLPPEALAAANVANAYQVQISGKDVNVYNFAMAHLRTLPGIDSATPQLINPEGTSYVLVAYRGDISQLAAALSARGWVIETFGDGRENAVVVRKAAVAASATATRVSTPATAAEAKPAARAAVMKRGPDQIALPLDWPQSDGDARFIVSDSNREAFEHFRHWSMWPVKATILTGPRRSGRTLLARSFIERVGGRLFDEAERRDEEELFHAWNQAQDTGRPVIMIADEPPPAWSPRLPDLKTRLAITPVTRIGHPDDVLFAALIQLLFADRGLHIPADALRFMAERLHRDYWTAERAVEAVDRFAISERARLSLPTIRRALIETRMIGEAA